VQDTEIHDRGKRAFHGRNLKHSAFHWDSDERSDHRPSETPRLNRDFTSSRPSRRSLRRRDAARLPRFYAVAIVRGLCIICQECSTKSVPGISRGGLRPAAVREYRRACEAPSAAALSSRSAGTIFYRMLRVRRGGALVKHGAGPQCVDHRGTRAPAPGYPPYPHPPDPDFTIQRTGERP
jgi:hypothetical protein